MCGARECVVGLGRVVARSDVGGGATAGFLTRFGYATPPFALSMNVIQLLNNRKNIAKTPPPGAGEGGTKNKIQNSEDEP